MVSFDHIRYRRHDGSAGPHLSTSTSKPTGRPCSPMLARWASKALYRSARTRLIAPGARATGSRARTRHAKTNSLLEKPRHARGFLLKEKPHPGPERFSERGNRPFRDGHHIGRSLVLAPSTNLDSSSRRGGEAGKQTPASGALSSIPGRGAGQLSSLLTIKGVVIIISLLSSLVVLKEAWRQDTVIDAISVPKDLEDDGYTPATMRQRIMDAVTQINRDVTLTKRLGMFRLSEL